MAGRPVLAEVARTAAELVAAERARARAAPRRAPGAPAGREPAAGGRARSDPRGRGRRPGADALRGVPPPPRARARGVRPGRRRALAVHFQGAGETERAARYAEDAAEPAARALAFDRAARLYRLALELRGGPPRRGHRLQRGAGRRARQRGAGRRGRGGLPGRGRRRPRAGRARAAPAAAEQFLRSGHIDLGLDAIRAVLRVARHEAWRAPRGARSPRWSCAGPGCACAGSATASATRETCPPDELIRIDACWSVAMGLSLVDNVRAADFQARHLLLGAARRRAVPDRARAGRGVGPRARRRHARPGAHAVAASAETATARRPAASSPRAGPGRG